MTRPRHYPICFWCKHFDEQRLSEPDSNKYCSAFPNGIPVEIWGEEYGPSFDHRLPYPDDKGIQFDKADYSILQKRRFFDQIPSNEVSDKIFELSAAMIRISHEGRIRIAENPPKIHYIIPLDLPESQSLRDRCKNWGFDLTLSDNQILISGHLYQQIHSDEQSYIKWLEEKFSDAKTRKEGAIVFGKIIDALIRESYP